MQSYDDRYYGTYKVRIITTPHSPTFTQALESLAKKIKRITINMFPLCLSYNADFCALAGPALNYSLSADFASAINSLRLPSLFEAEIEYIKALPEYQAFLSSSVLKELSSEIEHFEKNGYDDSAGWSFGMAGVKRCELSRPNCSPLKFTLFTDQYDDMPQMYEHVNLLRTKSFRALSIPEISMLAIALSEKYPHLFTCTLMVYHYPQLIRNLISDKKIFTFEFGLTPCIVKEAPKPIPEKKIEYYIDIY